MTLAIMQPYILPYLGYWQLINTVDAFVLYDNIQFSKKGWFHRNNILINNTKTLFTVPLKNESDYLDVKERFLSTDSEKYVKKILSQIENNYKKAPYYKDIFPLIQEIFCFNEKNLFNYILYSIKKICAYLDIETKIIISSEIDIDHGLKAQEKVIAINKELHADKYINPIGGIDIYNSETFESQNIELLFLNSSIPEYPQFNGEFVSHLSIIDILMFNHKDNIKQMLDMYTLVNNKDKNV